MGSTVSDVTVLRSNIEEGLAGWITRHCRVLTLLCVISTAIPAYFLRDVRINNSTEVWLGSQSRAYQNYRQFLDKYGNEEFVVIAAQAEDPLSETSLALQRQLVQDLKQIEHIETAFSLCTSADLLSEFRSDWKKQIQENDLFRNLLLGDDGRTFGLFVHLGPMEGCSARKETVQEIEQVIASVLPPEMNYYLAGPPFMNVALDRGCLRSAFRLMPLAIIISLVVLIVVLRSVSALIAVLLAVGITTVWTLGLLVGLGRTLNMITIAVPSILFVLSLSGGIHIASRYLSLMSQEYERTQALKQALSEVIRPVFLSNVTTAFGFGSLLISDMVPVKEFGIFTGLGILLSFCFNITVIPGLFRVLPQRVTPGSKATFHWTARIGTTVFHHYKAVMALSLALFLLTIVLTARTRVKSNVVEFFPEESKVRRDYEFIGEHLTGLYSVEIDASTTNQSGAKLLKALDRLGDQLADRPDVAKVMHYGKIASSFKHIHRPVLMRTSSLPDNPLSDMRKKYRHKEGQTLSLRLSVLIRSMENSDFFDIVDVIHAQAKDLFSNEYSYRITGIAPLANAAQRSLVKTQIASFSIAGTCILLFVGLFMKSFKALLASILPNFLPILSVFSLMVLMNIPLDPATVMIASIAIGIAADDTVHFLAHYKREKQQGHDTLVAIQNSLSIAGRAITYTSIVTSAGFVILLIADFKPIGYFGLFTAVTMVTAWLGDILVLPACVKVLGLWDDCEDRRQKTED
jgi:uncharacterized protein